MNITKTSINENIFLPAEILLEIFSNFNETELSVMELVSKQFHLIANDPILWKKFVRDRKITMSPIQIPSKQMVVNHVKEYIHALGPIALSLKIQRKVREAFQKWYKNLIDLDTYTSVQETQSFFNRVLAVSVRDL